MAASRIIEDPEKHTALKDDRKSIIRVNGSVLFKVREVYTQRLIDNVQAVINNGTVELNW